VRGLLLFLLSNGGRDLFSRSGFPAPRIIFSNGTDQVTPGSTQGRATPAAVSQITAIVADDRSGQRA
jgi:hypothetical protein